MPAAGARSGRASRTQGVLSRTEGDLRRGHRFCGICVLAGHVEGRWSCIAIQRIVEAMGGIIGGAEMVRIGEGAGYTYYNFPLLLSLKMLCRHLSVPDPHHRSDSRSALRRKISYTVPADAVVFCI